MRCSVPGAAAPRRHRTRTASAPAASTPSMDASTSAPSASLAAMENDDASSAGTAPPSSGLRARVIATTGVLARGDVRHPQGEVRELVVLDRLERLGRIGGRVLLHRHAGEHGAVHEGEAAEHEREDGHGGDDERRRPVPGGERAQAAEGCGGVAILGGRVCSRVGFCGIVVRKGGIRVGLEGVVVQDGVDEVGVEEGVIERALSGLERVIALDVCVNVGGCAIIRYSGRAVIGCGGRREPVLFLIPLHGSPLSACDGTQCSKSPATGSVRGRRGAALNGRLRRRTETGRPPGRPVLPS